MSDVVSYIRGLGLPAAPKELATREPPAAMTGGTQALAIGSQLIEFTAKVPQTQRAAISNGLLLGQLAADKATGGKPDCWEWFDAYNAVLKKIGWLQTIGEKTEEAFSDRNAELHQAIIPLVSVVFGPAVATSSIIIEVLKGLEKMNSDAPWITLFERKSRKVTAAMFGLSHVDGEDGAGAVIKTVFFALDARQVLTQVLFLKLTSANATVRSGTCGGVLTAETIAAAGAALAEKVQPFIVENIKNIDI